MAISKTEKLSRIHQAALASFDRVQMAVRDERFQCLSDRRFVDVAGAMWEGPYGMQFDNRPRLEVNKIALGVERIINEYRNNRITVYFEPTNGTTDKVSSAIEGLYRADEYDSQAQEARDNAFEEAVKGGFGAYRVRARYEDEYDDENDYQRIGFEPIFDADTCVFFDLDAKRRDKSDAKECWVLTGMTREAYVEAWGPTEFGSWPHAIYSNFFDWLTPNVVYVAEYYKVEEAKEKIYIFTGLDGEEKRISAEEADEEPEDGEPSMLQQLMATGFQKTGEKTVKRRRVHKYIMSGAGILEDCGLIAGCHIPIVPVFGKRTYVDNQERMQGHVRRAKDAQRLKNMQLSSLAELAAKSSMEKPIFLPEQMAGHELQWAEDNVKDYPYLMINPYTDGNGNAVAQGPLGYTKPPMVAPAMGALLQITEQDMADILGNQQQGEEIQSNISGRAVELIQNRLDMQAFIYMDNMAVAVRRDAEIWLSMAKELYIDEGRVMKTIAEENSAISSVTLKRPIQGESGEVQYENDLASVRMDVRTEIGPTSQSKRSSTVRALTQMMAITEDPQTKSILASTVMMNMDGQGLSDIRDYFRRQLVMAGAVKPTEDEKKAIAAQSNQPPSPQDQYLQAAAKEANANAVLKQADTVQRITQADKNRSETAKNYAEIGLDAQAQELEGQKALAEFVQLGMPQQ